MSNVNGGTISVRVEGKDIGLSDLLNRINQQMAASGQNARNYATQMAAIDPVLKRSDQELARYAQSLAAVAKAQGDSLGSQRLLVQALQEITPATTSANQVTLQLQNSLNEQNKATTAGSGGLKQLAAGVTSVIGVYAVATRVVGSFAEAIGQGNELEKTLTTFRVLSGSADEYQQNLAIARQQQDTFGGSLNDVVTGMSEFANLSHRTGIEVNRLTNLARALATVDPAQGFKGASIALKEFLSGDNVTSLARRFEIPREALNSIEKLTDKRAQFDALTEALQKFGISEELVTAQANTTAVSFDKLSGAAADAKAALGTALASAFEQSAKNITKELEAVSTGLTTLVTRSEQLQGFAGKIFDQTATGGLDAFNEKIRQTNAAIDSNAGIFSIFVGHLQELTPAQYAYAASLVATGTSTQDALAKTQALQGVADQLQNTLGNNANAARFSAESIKSYGAAALAVSASSAEGADFVNELTAAVLAGDISIQQATFQLQQFQAGLAAASAQGRDTTAVTSDLLNATTLFTAALNEEAQAKILSQVQGDALKLTQEQLYNAALAAAQGMGATQQSAQVLASQFSITTGEAYNLIAALSQLEVAKAKQALGVQAGGANEREDRLGTNEDIIQRAKDVELRKKLADIQFANNVAAADYAGKLQLQRDALSRLDKGTVEYETQLGKVQAAERDLAAFREREAKKHSGAPKLTPNEKINTKLLDDQDKFNNKFEDAEQKHWDKVADIYAKFNEAQQKQFAQNEVSKRRSRADFYAGLQDAPAGVDTRKFAQQYEEAFAEAQKIAQSGKAKLAADFLDLRTKQIQEMQKLDEDAAKIQQEQKEGKISKKDADSQLEFLAGRKKLIEDAQAEEQKLLLAQGDENQNKLNEQLAAEEQAYSDSVDKISSTAERAAEAKIKHAQRSKIAVSEENKELANQAGYYEKIARLNGGSVPASKRGTAPTSSGGTQGQDNKPVDVSASSPIPVESGDGLLVRQSGIFLVQDDDVISTLGDIGARLEGKLGEVVQAVNSARDSITSAVSAVEGAVGRIRISSPSVVGN